MMKILGVIDDDNYLDYITSNLDGIIFPIVSFAVDYNRYYTLDEIKEYKNRTSKECFVVINKMIFNDEIDSLLNLLKQLELLNPTGVFFYDLAILNLVMDNNINLNLIFNQTHMVTNSDTINAYYNLGVKGAYLSNEITKADILKIRDNTNSDLFVFLVGKCVTAFSRRKLLRSYFAMEKLSYHNELIIKEPKTLQEFLLREDDNGTTFYYNKRLNLSNVYLELKERGINYGIIAQDDFNKDVYLELIDSYKNFNKKKIDEIVGRNRGFLYRETVYKVK